MRTKTRKEPRTVNPEPEIKLWFPRYQEWLTPIEYTFRRQLECAQAEEVGAR